VKKGGHVRVEKGHATVVEGGDRVEGCEPPRVQRVGGDERSRVHPRPGADDDGTEKLTDDEVCGDQPGEDCERLQTFLVAFLQYVIKICRFHLLRRQIPAAGESRAANSIVSLTVKDPNTSQPRLVQDNIAVAADQSAHPLVRHMY
jgi:hypothetical protein